MLTAIISLTAALLADAAYQRPQLERLGGMIAADPAMRRVFEALRRVATVEAPVLLYGETGVGKDLAAHAIHDLSDRKDRPFVAINVAAIPDNLLESELFGHVKGAFTGATQSHRGAFQQANHGTLFLDEIGELTPQSQARLLRAIETGSIRPVGAEGPTQIDVRIIAATNRDLLEMVSDGTFRGDLYFRLAQLPIVIPPLRERARYDLAPIARFLLQQINPDATITEEALARLMDHNWPGNVRELRAVLMRAVLMGGLQVDEGNLIFSTMPLIQFSPQRSRLQLRAEIVDALRAEKGNRTRAAKRLKIPRSTMLSRIETFRIQPEEYLEDPDAELDLPIPRRPAPRRR